MTAPSCLTCCIRGDVCGIEPCNDVSDIVEYGYPDAAAVAMAAACEGETYCGCIVYAEAEYGGCIIICWLAICGCCC